MAIRQVLPWVSGFFVAIGLMVFDEVLTLARYCGPDCYYEVPYIGGLTQYGAEIFAWLLILVGFSIMMLLTLPVSYKKPQRGHPEGYSGKIGRQITPDMQREAEDKLPEV